VTAETMTGAAAAADSAESPAGAGGHQLGVETVPIKLVAPHPENPRKNLGDRAELTASIREQGIVQPPVVMPADRVAAAWPEHAEVLTGARWVVLVGHRRHASAADLAAGDDEAVMPVLVRGDAICDDRLAQLDAMTVENVARQPLSPMEEARAFDAARRAGRTSQRQIAAVFGCSQAHVSKRLSLLALPAELVDLLEAEQLEIGAAMAYAAAAAEDGPEVALQAYREASNDKWLTPQRAVETARRELKRQADIAAALEKLTAEGVRVVDNVSHVIREKSWEHLLHGKKAIDRARKDGTLIAEVTRLGDIRYYTTATPKRNENLTDYDRQRRHEERERSRALQAREAACHVIAAGDLPKPNALIGLLAAAVVHRSDAESRRLARRWLLAARDPVATAAADHHDWRTAVFAHDDPATVVRAAYTIALAADEAQARWNHSAWEDRTVAHLARLGAEAGYQPSDWEQERLAAARGGHQRYPRDAVRLCHHQVDGWVLHVAGEEASHDGIDVDDVDAAKVWAVRVLADDYNHDAPTYWQHSSDPHEVYSTVYTAVYDDEYQGDDQDDAATAGVDSAESVVGELVVLHSAVDGWTVMRGEYLVEAAGPDIAEDDHDAALDWAEEVLNAAKVPVAGWAETRDPYGGPAPAYTPKVEGVSA
jgi:ParB family chromosome partitioning protein